MEKLGDESGAPFAFYILRKRKGNHYRVVVKALSWREDHSSLQVVRSGLQWSVGRGPNSEAAASFYLFLYRTLQTKRRGSGNTSEKKGPQNSWFSVHHSLSIERFPLGRFRLWSTDSCSTRFKDVGPKDLHMNPVQEDRRTRMRPRVFSPERNARLRVLFLLPTSWITTTIERTM